MTALLVAYDLSSPGQDYQDFYEIIKGYPWVKLSESAYAISTKESTKTVYGKLETHMDQNDQVYVVNLGNDWSGYGPKDINNWLTQNL